MRLARTFRPTCLEDLYFARRQVTRRQLGKHNVGSHWVCRIRFHDLVDCRLDVLDGRNVC